MTEEWRIVELERRLTKLEETKPDVIAERVQQTTAGVADLREEMKMLKRALYSFAFTISAAAVGVAFAVMH